MKRMRVRQTKNEWRKESDINGTSTGCQTALDDDRVVMTQSQFDELHMVTKMNCVERNGWYPTFTEAMDIAENFRENYEFIYWILESDDTIRPTAEAKETEEFLQDVMREHLTIVPDEDAAYIPAHLKPKF